MNRGLQFKLILVFQVFFILALFGISYLVAEKIDEIILKIEQIKAEGKNGEKDG